MDLTWSLYAAGYKASFCHKAIAYTYDPETFKVHTKQMRRWASGFFQNFQSHKREVVKSPAAILVVGSLLFDLLTLPVTYGFAIMLAVRHPATLDWDPAEHRDPLGDRDDHRDAHDRVEASPRRLSLLLARELVEQGDLPLDLRQRVDPRASLHVVDRATGSSNRNRAHERQAQVGTGRRGRADAGRGRASVSQSSVAGHVREMLSAISRVHSP